MVSYGPWLEGPEFEETWYANVNTRNQWGVAEDVAIASTNSEQWVEPADYYQPIYADTLALHAGLPYASPSGDGWASGSGAATSIVQTFFTWAYTPTGVFPETFTTDLDGFHDYGPRSTQIFERWSPDEWPTGAIGVEFRSVATPDDPNNNQANPIGLWLRADTEVGGRYINETDTPDVPMSWSTTIAGGLPDSTTYDSNGDLTEVVRGGMIPVASVGTTVGPPGARVAVLGSEVDVSDFIHPAGRVALFSITEDFPPEAHGVLSTLAVQGARSFGYGFALRLLSLRGLFKAPEYRFIYDSVPHRRTYPRDDGLAGGARRTYPPSKGYQSGNRTSGGIF